MSPTQVSFLSLNGSLSPTWRLEHEVHTKTMVMFFLMGTIFAFLKYLEMILFKKLLNSLFLVNTQLRDYSSLCDQGSLVKGFRAIYVVLGIELG